MERRRAGRVAGLTAEQQRHLWTSDKIQLPFSPNYLFHLIELLSNILFVISFNQISFVDCKVCQRDVSAVF